MRKKHGGRRKGAGRPAADGAQDLRRVLIMLTEDQIEKARKLGGGNVSLGIRKALFAVILKDKEETERQCRK